MKEKKHHRPLLIFTGKRASLQDVIFIAAAVFIISTVTLLGFKLSDVFNTRVQADDTFPSDAKSMSTDMMGKYPSLMDKSMLTILILLSIVTLVLAALVRVHPIFIPFYLLGLVAVIFISAGLSNAYETMASNVDFASLAAQLTQTAYIMNRLPWFVGIIGTLLMMVQYKLWSINQ